MSTRTHIRFLIPTLALLALAAPRAHAVLYLPAVFSDHMVLEAGQPDPVWGWAGSTSTITVRFVDASGAVKAEAKTQTEGDGRWSLRLPALPAGLAGRLEISEGRNDSRRIEDVLVGEVWLASGQSNMEYRIATNNRTQAMIDGAKREAAEARGALRFFYVATNGSDTEQDDVKGRWYVGSPDTVGLSSAVAWYFGVRLHDKLGCPVALLESSVGATPAEAWIPVMDLNNTSASSAIWQRNDEKLAEDTPANWAKYQADLAAFSANYPTHEAQQEHASERPHEPYTARSHNVPGRFYNGMIHGLEPYGTKGIIWYQGDGNGGFPLEYPVLIQALIRSWRGQWGAELPFYYVEMNNMWEHQTQPVESSRNMALLREMQEGALELPKTGVATAIDLGDETTTQNPHFPNKKPVGDRLANLALSEVYGASIGSVHSPQLDRFEIQGSRIRIHLRHATGLRVRGGGELRGFAIRGQDGVWKWAQGQIEGRDLVLWSPDVPEPVAVRYAWATNPIISVENGAGLPLRPFRTDKESPK